MVKTEQEEDREIHRFCIPRLLPKENTSGEKLLRFVSKYPAAKSQMNAFGVCKVSCHGFSHQSFLTGVQV